MTLELICNLKDIKLYGPRIETDTKCSGCGNVMDAHYVLAEKKLDTKDVHFNLKVFVCEPCEKVFANKADLEHP
jgi:uncharacterized protein (UPF0212 family)